MTPVLPSKFLFSLSPPIFSRRQVYYEPISNYNPLTLLFLYHGPPTISVFLKFFILSSLPPSHPFFDRFPFSLFRTLSFPLFPSFSSLLYDRLSDDPFNTGHIRLLIRTPFVERLTLLSVYFETHLFMFLGHY